LTLTGICPEVVATCPEAATITNNSQSHINSILREEVRISSFSKWLVAFANCVQNVIPEKPHCGL